MKKVIFLFSILFTAMLGKAQNFSGVWNYQEGTVSHTLYFIDGYFSYSIYDIPNKKFINTKGGTYDQFGDIVEMRWEYDASKAGKDLETWLGKKTKYIYALSPSELKINITGTEQVFKKTSDVNNDLAGVWRITDRKQGDQMNAISLGDRRTLKILTGNTFQWVAINIKTGEFSGTGGGKYTFKDGKYTEQIEYFSRDNNRVGASLSFDAKVEDGKWHHSGQSSSGAPIYEIWGKLR